MELRADLHVHSYYSDGTLSAEDILYLAVEKKLFAISITDHDTICAYSDNLFKLASKLNIKLITGVEISSLIDNESVHILGYNFDYDFEDFINFLKKVQEIRVNRNLEILKKLKEKKIDISEEELNAFAKKNNILAVSVGRVHIAQLMYEKGYVQSVQMAFDRYIKDGGPCYVFKYKYTPSQIINKIHQAKGKAILAHPSFIKSQKIIDKLLSMPFDGIEVYYAKLLPHQEKKWLEIARGKKILITGGSDFHGENKPFIDLGCSWIDKENLDKLIS